VRIEQWRSEVLVVEGLADQIAELEGIVGYSVAQVRVLGMVPARFDRVQIGSLGRQPFDTHPVGSLLLQQSHCRAMRIQGGADQEDRAAGWTPQFQ
jgi:hypothetical protein